MRWFIVFSNVPYCHPLFDHINVVVKRVKYCYDYGKIDFYVSECLPTLNVYCMGWNLEIFCRLVYIKPLPWCAIKKCPLTSLKKCLHLELLKLHPFHFPSFCCFYSCNFDLDAILKYWNIILNCNSKKELWFIG